ncbi:Lysine--tRNA ligase [Trichinella spiralis]|uniref:Lysine--tRNA ligase n=1 Tax=Trichinella spiralis TaxID=6334 RepID=A0ABR3KU10_TRISP
MQRSNNFLLLQNATTSCCLTFAGQAIRFDSLLIIQLILRNNFADLICSGIQGLFLKVTRSFDDIFFCILFIII